MRKTTQLHNCFELFLVFVIVFLYFLNIQNNNCNKKIETNESGYVKILQEDYKKLLNNQKLIETNSTIEKGNVKKIKSASFKPEKVKKQYRKSIDSNIPKEYISENQINPDWFEKNYKNKDFQLIDIRSIDDYALNRLKDAVYVDTMEETLSEIYAKIDKTKPTIIYCKTGIKSNELWEELNSIGADMKNIFILNTIVDCNEKECSINKYIDELPVSDNVIDIGKIEVITEPLE